MSWSPKGRLLTIGGQKVSQTLWRRSGDIVSIAFSPEGEILAIGSHQRVELWHTASGRLLAPLPEQAGYVTALAFSPDGRYLAYGSSREKTEIMIWDVHERQIIARLSYTTKYADRVIALAFSPKGEHLAAVGLDQNIRIWPLKKGRATGQPPRIFSESMFRPQSIAFSPAHEIIAVGSAEGQIALFDLKKGKIIRKLEGHQGSVHALLFSDKGLISSGSDRMLRYWNAEFGALLKTERIHSLTGEIVISKDGRFGAVSRC